MRRTALSPGARRLIAVDGRTLRGSGTLSGAARHLLAALDHGHGVVLGQVDVEAKTDEIPMFATLLDGIDLAGAVVTADALHAQRAHAGYLARRGAHYLITVKGDQPACAPARRPALAAGPPSLMTAARKAAAAPDGAP